MILDRETKIFLVCCWVFAHMLILSLLVTDNLFYNGIRFILEKDLPVLFFVGLYAIPELKTVFSIKLTRNLVEYGVCLLGCFVVFSLLIGLFGGLNFIELFRLKWSYIGSFQWIFAIILFYRILRFKGIQKLEGGILAFLFADLGGMIYELPIYYRMNPLVGIFVHWTHPFFIEFRWILLILMFFYLRKNYSFGLAYADNFVAFLLGLICLFAFSMIYFSYYMIPLVGLVARLPTILFLAICLSLIKRKEITNA